MNVKTEGKGMKRLFVYLLKIYIRTSNLLNAFVLIFKTTELLDKVFVADEIMTAPN